MRRRPEPGAPVVALVLALLALACANTVVTRARAQMESGDLPGARAALDPERGRSPGSGDVHVALGEVYYRLAREELDRFHDEAAYLAFLEKSIHAFLVALEIDPRDERPHFYLAMMDAYRGDLPRAMRGFQNARRLEPSGVAHTNIAEIYVYMGHRHKARYWNTLGVRKGAPPGTVIFNEMLLDWKEGDIDGARRRFQELKRDHPDMIRTINVARLPEEPREFEDFAGYCCRSPACGPYMLAACRELSLEVNERRISRETVLEELRLEMETQRRLNELYGQRKELDIDLDIELELEDEDGDEAGAAPPGQ